MKNLYRTYFTPVRALLFFSILALVLYLVATQVRGQSILQKFEVAPLTIELADGRRHDFQVEMAENRDQQVQGLMYRRSLDPAAGMLFVYDNEAERTMWMKNTLIPLDMVFIGEDGQVVSYHERAVPESLATISSGLPAMAVLELNSGTISRLGIQPGDRVLHPAFGNTP